MSQAIVTFQISDYFPSDFNFTNFSFIISSESREFEQEISYSSKNKISHKFQIPKKEAKYSIKVIKKNSLIGISDITLPSYILQKKEKTFDKTCIINTTDSIKRVLFGNTSPENIIKINIHCTIEYKEKEKNNQKLNHSNSSNKTKMNVKNLKDIASTASTGTFSLKNLSINKNDGKNLIPNNIKKQNTNSKPKLNYNIKSPKTIKPKTQIFNSENKNIKENIRTKEYKKNAVEQSDKKKNVNEKDEKNDNESMIDEELNKEIKGKDEEFHNFMDEFIKEKQPMEKLDSMNDINELKEYTKNNILELIEYQMKFYSLFKSNIDRKNKLNNIMLVYNEKFRNTKKEINKLDELIDIYDIKTDIIENNKYNSEKSLLSLKENELDNFNQIYKNSTEKENKNQNKEEEDNKIQFMEKTKNLLIKVLQQCIDKYGPINKIYTLTNSTESERINIRKLANKYNLPINTEIKEEEEIIIQKKEDNDNSIKQEENNNEDNKEINKEHNEDNTINNETENEKEEKEENEEKEEKEENKNNIFEGKITKWEYVSTEKPDKIDKKLELYLKYFYSKRSFPIVIFRKTSTNNYEYGKQKIMIKIEGDTIRVRHVGGYLILDKFIELNAANEEKKLKKINEKNKNTSIATKKKDNNQKKKAK